MTGSVVMSGELVDFAEGLARIATAGGGVAALAAHLASTLRAAVLVEDGDWRHLALVGSGTRSVPASAREPIGAVQRNGSSAVVPLRRQGEEPDGIAAPLGGHEAPLGWLSVFPSNSLAPFEIDLVRLAAATIAVGLSREADGGRNRRKSFWDRLIARAYDDPIEARDDAASRGISLARSYVAVAIEAEGLEEPSAAGKLAELRRICADALRSGSNDVAVIERGGGFVFLCATPLEIDAQNVRTAATLIPRHVAKLNFGAKVVGGVGRPAEAIGVHRTVEEARASTFIARRLFDGGRVMPFEELGVYPLLLAGGTTAEELRDFAGRVLEPLRSYDERHQGELLRTLRLYFDVGQNVKIAAAQLAVHRHTVFYRLRQIAEITGNSLDSAHHQLTLRTAMAIDALNARER